MIKCALQYILEIKSNQIKYFDWVRLLWKEIQLKGNEFIKFVDANSLSVLPMSFNETEVNYMSFQGGV